MNAASTSDILKSIALSLNQGETLTLSDYFLKVLEPMSIVKGLRLKELIKITGINCEVTVNPNIAFDHYQALFGNKLVVSDSINTLLQSPDTFCETFDSLNIAIMPPVSSKLTLTSDSKK